MHRELRRIAFLNDRKIYEVTDALLEDCLKDEECVNAAVKKLKQ